jgi:hypothetical protein
MVVEKWGVVERECDAGREDAMGWACGCRDYSGEECRAVLCVYEPVVVIVSGFAEGVVVARNMVMELSPIGFAWGHISSTRAIVGVFAMVWSDLS